MSSCQSQSAPNKVVADCRQVRPSFVSRAETSSLGSRGRGGGSAKVFSRGFVMSQRAVIGLKGLHCDFRMRASRKTMAAPSAGHYLFAHVTMWGFNVLTRGSKQQAK